MPKQRLTLSLSDATIDRLALVANYRKGAKSALVEEALDRYLNPEKHRLLDNATLRRLDTMSRSLSTIARDGAIATETLSLFVRYFLTITPPLPATEQDAARALGRQRFEVFVAQVGRRLANDQRLVSEILESIAAYKPDLFSKPDDDATPPATSGSADVVPLRPGSDADTPSAAETTHG